MTSVDFSDAFDVESGVEGAGGVTSLVEAFERLEAEPCRSEASSSFCSDIVIIVCG
jgi:hypothetical protein